MSPRRNRSNQRAPSASIAGVSAATPDDGAWPCSPIQSCFGPRSAAKARFAWSSPNAKSRRPCMRKTGVRTFFSAEIEERAAANGRDGRHVAAVGGVADREHLRVDALRVEAADEPGDDSGLREPLRRERREQVGPRDRDLERRPRHARPRASSRRRRRRTRRPSRRCGRRRRPAGRGARRRRPARRRPRAGRRSRSARRTRRGRARRTRARRSARRFPSPGRPRAPLRGSARARA